MADGRFLLKSLSTSQRYARLTTAAGPLADFAQALYPLLVAHADDRGRVPGDAFTVKHVVCPTSAHSEADVDRAIAALLAVGLVTRDTDVTTNRARLSISGFAARQPMFGHPTLTPSLPPPVPPPISSPESTNEESASEVQGEAIRTVGVGYEQGGYGGERKGVSFNVGQMPWRGSWSGLIYGPNPRHAFDGPRVHVPQYLHDDFVKLRHHANAERELFAWYEAVSDEWTTGAQKDAEPGADMFVFWKARYNERWPPDGARIDRRPKWARE